MLSWWPSGGSPFPGRCPSLKAPLGPSEHLCAHQIPRLTITTATEVMVRQGVSWGFEPTRDQPQSPKLHNLIKRVGPLLSTWHGWSPCKLVATQRLNLSGLHTGKALSQNEKVLQSYIWLLVLSVPTAPSQNEVLGGKSPPYISHRHLRRESNFREGHKEFLSPSGGILLSLLVL